MKTFRIKFNGRLGNQMFQYAFARALQLKLANGGGKMVFDFTCMCLSSQNGSITANNDNMLKYYNVVPFEYVDLDNYNRCQDGFMQRLIWKMLRKIKRINHFFEYYIERFDYFFLPLFGMYYMESYNCTKHFYKTNSNNIWIRGWFESASYFKEYDDIICQELTPKAPIPNNLKGLHKILKDNHSICVHVRRGDFASANARLVTCTIDYYKDGISAIKDKHPDALIFLCSDDLDWAKENLGLENNEKLIYEPSNIPIYETLRLMTSCHHFVMSNSTFSWWAQHLATYKNKIVVAPKIWRKEHPLVRDIYEKNWILK